MNRHERRASVKSIRHSDLITHLIPSGVPPPEIATSAHLQFYLARFLAWKASAPWTPGLSAEGFISDEITRLHASLSSAFLCLRHVAIASASGMNSPQSRNTSGVQARRSSGVPCARDDVAVTHSQPRSKHN
jgi:hypothetical protein